MKFHKLGLKEVIIVLCTFLLGMTAYAVFNQPKITEPVKKGHWEFQSIDTMKNSRDLAREELHDTNFAQEVDKQVADIAATGATHIAIGTPYDDEFLPVIKLWVRTARKYDLKVWYRGNWSGWEQWFGYSKIDEQTHINNTRQFILNNSNLFENGDVFTSCPECENGAKLETGNSFAVVQYRRFLIDEYTSTKGAFAQIGKDVKANYYSMNADVAKTVMDRETTKELDGVVVIDHYVRTPEQLANDVSIIAQQSGGQIVLGEIGVPIPDIHGKMNEEERAQWLDEALLLLSQKEELIGMNYWVNLGGSTALWDKDGKPTKTQEVLMKYYKGK